VIPVVVHAVAAVVVAAAMAAAVAAVTADGYVYKLRRCNDGKEP